MAKMNINGVNLEFDVFELENARKYTEGLKKIEATAAKLNDNTDVLKAIETQCTVVFEFIDSLFGKDTHRELFGDSVNLKTCLKVFNDIVKTISADTVEVSEFANSISRNA